MCRVYAAKISMQLLPSLVHNIPQRRISLLPNIGVFNIVLGGEKNII